MVTMLSRVAESLYWMGRYVERAEDTARIVDVNYHRLLEEAKTSKIWQNLIGSMGVAEGNEDVEPTAATALRLLAFDLTSPSSVIGAIASARECARGARESISSEMWSSLNSTYFTVLAPETRTEGGAHHFFAYVKERAALFSGLADSTMAHDDGWQFIHLGRSLERVDMTARLLGSCLSQGSSFAAWTRTLRSCSAYDSYLRTYRRGVDAQLVVEFLLLDRLFPRSVYSSLLNAESHLNELVPEMGRVGRADPVRRTLGRLRASLQYLKTDEILEDFPNFLGNLQHGCSEAHKEIEGKFFRHNTAVMWQA